MVGVILWRLRDELPQLARRVRRLRVPGAEADLDPQVRQLDEAATEAESEIRPQLPPTPAPSGARDAILQLAAQDPRLGVVKLVTEIEVRVRDLASIAGHDNPQGAPWPQLMQWLVERGTVPPGVASATDLIRQVRNRVVHGRTVDDRDVATTIDAGLRLFQVLEAIPDYGYEVRGMVPIYQDAEATTEHTEGRGIVLWDFDAQRQHRDYRVYPTRLKYEAGELVGWQWSFDRTWGQAYWRDPWDRDAVKLAWTESAEFVGQRLLRQDDGAA
jgi:hypothetical protein